MKVEPRFTKESGLEVFTGNELLLKGCLETEGGVHLMTGYPGSPISGFFDAANDLKELLLQKGIRACLANNEALGVAMVNGSQMHGLRAIAVQKSVGVHVAADALALGNLVGAHPEGGAVIVLGDDPWSDTTQVPADSRYLCKHLMMPVLEPSDPQELKDWINLAFKLSRASELYIGYLVTTNQADGGGTVEVRPNCYPTVNTRQRIELDTAGLDLERSVLLPPRTWRKEQGMAGRYAQLWASARRHQVNQVLAAASPAPGGIGFVTSAAAYCYLRHALAELGVDGCFSILKLGVTYPLDPSLIAEFAAGLTDLVVIEERRGFLEEQVVEILNRARRSAEAGSPLLASQVWGKQFPRGLPGIPDTRGLNPSKLIDRVGQLLLAVPGAHGRVDTARVRDEVELVARLKANATGVLPRTPTFCPGCPHRDSAAVFMEIKRVFRDAGYMEKTHQTGPVDLVFHGDTGCYTMLMFEPTKDLMHNYSGMGLGGGTGAGIDPFIRNKQVVFMGDSTFFHCGQLAISNSLKQGQDITYIILDNKTTAMTGHQPTPGLDEGLLGEPTFAQKLEAIIAAMADTANSGVTVARINPAESVPYRQLLEKTLLRAGVKVVIADKECGITFHRRVARDERREVHEKGYVARKRYINITPEVCENCRECTRATGCPGLTLEQTAYGPKVQTDLSWCVSDGACTRFLIAVGQGGQRVKSCPAFEEVTVLRTQRPESPFDRLDFSGLPSPPVVTLDRTWHGYLAGVGGMGIGTATAVLVLAGHREGHRVLFCDKKGLAIRNGGVYSMVSYLPKDAPFCSNLIPYGKADLLLGIDLLEAARALDASTNQRVGSPERTVAVINTHETPTIHVLIGKDEFHSEQLEAALKRMTRAQAYFGCDISELAEKFFGTQLYANMMLLGTAFQRGLLPVSLQNLESSIKAGLGSAAPDNLRAFNVGRLLVQDAAAVRRAVGLAAPPATFEATVADKADLLARTRFRGGQLGGSYRLMLERASGQLQLRREALREFARRAYDLVQYDGLHYAQRYVEWVKEIHAWDRPDKAYRATEAVIWNLHKVMAIKDEIYVAHLLTSEEKRRRDQGRYGVSPARGDRLEYRHFNRPQVRVWGRDFAWDMNTRDWMLNVVKRLRWVRRWLPDWHRAEKDFREWYIGLLPRFREASVEAQAYETFLRVLRLPESVTGYREIRYPKMTAAMAQAAEWLKEPAPKPAAAPPLVVA